MSSFRNIIFACQNELTELASLPQSSVSSLFRKSALETVFRPFPAWGPSLSMCWNSLHACFAQEREKEHSAPPRHPILCLSAARHRRHRPKKLMVFAMSWESEGVKSLADLKKSKKSLGGVSGGPGCSPKKSQKRVTGAKLSSRHPSRDMIFPAKLR